MLRHLCSLVTSQRSSQLAGVERSAQGYRRAPIGDPAVVHVAARSKIRTGHAQECRSELRPARPAGPEHRPARSCSALALTALVAGLIARRAIALSSRDTPNRHYEWPRYAAIPARSLTPPVRSDARPPVRCSLAPARAQSPRVQQTKDIFQTAASPKARTLLVAFRLPS